MNDDFDLPLVEFRPGLFRRRAPVAADFRLGGRYSDGLVHRYVLDLHAEFEDDGRIVGDFVLLNVPVASIEDSEFECDEEVAEEFAARPTPLPHIVLNENFAIIDGGHRHRAAQIRGDLAILAFVPVAVAGRLSSHR